MTFAPMMFWLRFWFPLWAYSAIIFVLSSMPSSSLGFTAFFWDKALHALEYALLGFLAARAMGQGHQGYKFGLWAVVVIFCFGFGLSDEFHQSFTPGRQSALSDAYADLVGSALGAAGYIIIQQLLAKRKVGVG